jgi:imidazolonepropionase-like amidohydrolase
MQGAPEAVEQLLARPEAKYLSPATRRFWRDAPFARLQRTDDGMTRLQNARELVRAFQADGVRLLLGTDAGLWGNAPGFTALEELDLLVGSGLTPYDALRAATVEPAAFLNAHIVGARQPGAMAVGNRADLILLNGDPLETVASVGRMAGVMVRGQWLPRRQLDKMLEELSDEYAGLSSPRK